MKFDIRDLVFFVILAAIPVSTWMTVFQPADDVVETIQQEVRLKKQQVQKLNKAMAIVGDLEAEIDDLGEAIGHFESKLPDDKEIDKVLQEIWTLAESTQMDPQSVRPGSTGKSRVGNGKSKEQPIHVQLSGTFEGLYRFLQELENQPRITQVTSMRVSPGGDSPVDPLAVELTMLVFFEGG